MTDLLHSARETVRREADGLAALRTALADSQPLGRALLRLHDAIRAAAGRTIVTGMGKSGHIARKIAATLASTGTPAAFVHPAEASHGDLGMIGENDVVIALSNSGETRELADITAYCARFSIPLAVMTSQPDSSVARAADIVLLLPAADEACAVTRAPTTSAVMMLALGDALSVALLQGRGFGRDDFKTFHPGGKLGAAFRRVSDVMRADALPLVSPNAALPDVVAAINAGGAGTVGVSEAGMLVGVVTDGDLRRALGADLDGLTARMLMSRSPVTVAPDMLAADALGLLNRRRIQVLFVVDAERPVGLLHIHDFLTEGVA